VGYIRFGWRWLPGSDCVKRARRTNRCRRSLETRLRMCAAEVELSHLDKVMFPENGITKGDVVE
jgi:hypothetical protein